ncbi:MAG: hypothetical protein RLZZ584_2460 [Pseudomonadota bacterium]|jgi:CRISPR-associated protein Cas6
MRLASDGLIDLPGYEHGGSADLPAASLIDVAFELQASDRQLPADHQPALVATLDATCPGWSAHPGAGAHPLALASGGLLSRRTRLLLRVPRDTALTLVAPDGLLHRALQPVGMPALRLEAPQLRELLPWSALHAHFVVMDDEAATEPGDAAAAELAFMLAAARALQALAVRGRVICGRRQQRHGPRLGSLLQGHSLMVDQLGPADALRLLEHGLGRHRRLGWGLFVPHRSAAAVGSPHG